MNMQSSIQQGAEIFKNALKGVSDEMQVCINNCLTCHVTCMQLIQHCLQQGGPHAAPDHIRLLQDCADICAVSANFMIRGSELHTRTCAACADVCLACAEDCERFGDDEMMQNCAKVCRRCAESCRKMAASH